MQKLLHALFLAAFSFLFIHISKINQQTSGSWTQDFVFLIAYKCFRKTGDFLTVYYDGCLLLLGWTFLSLKTIVFIHKTKIVFAPVAFSPFFSYYC